MGSNSFTGSNKLMKLAQQLSLYNPLKETHINNSIIISVKKKKKKKKKNPVDLENNRLRPKSNRAAVLICLFEDEAHDLRVILTKRSSTLSSHSGEVSLPGGKWEESDADDVQTALREAQEEIGLDPSLVDVVSVLQPITTKHGMIVVPVIGILYDKNAFNPAPNAAEVEAIFDAPLEMFLKDENRTEEEREWMGNKYLLHFFDYEAENKKYVIWALTAGILITAASLVYQKQPAFSERKPKFWTTSHQ